MFEPKLNYLYFDPSEIISMSDDNIVMIKSIIIQKNSRN